MSSRKKKQTAPALANTVHAPKSMPPNSSGEVSSAASIATKPIIVQAVVLIGVALLERGLHFFLLRDSLLFQALICDAGQYDIWARRIAGGEWIGKTVFYQTPLYPYLLAVIYSLFGPSAWAVRICQALFGAVACVALARAGARFFDERVGWIAGLFLALYPPAIFFDGILQKASLDLLLMTTLLWVVARAQDSAQFRWFIAAGAALGAMTLNRENAAALAPLLLFWIGWLAWPKLAAVALPRAAMFCLGLALALVPVGLRNYYVGGAFLLTTSQMGSNFYIGNHAGASGGYDPMRAGRGDPTFESEDARILAEDDLKRPLTSREVSRYWMDRSWQFIRQNPVAWARLLAWKWFMTWNAAEAVDAEALSTHARQSWALATLEYALHFGVLIPLAALGIWTTRRDWRRLWILYAMLLVFAAAVTAFFVFARYRYPMAPVAALFAGAGIASIWDFIREPNPVRRRDVVFGLALAAVAAVFCNWPIPHQFSEDAITYYNAGTALAANNRPDDALAMFHQALEADPTFPETYINIGRQYAARGDAEQSQRFYEQGIALNPEHAILHVNLAEALQNRGDQAGALAELKRAIELDPLLGQAYQPLAALEMQLGQLQAAVQHLRRAIEINPASAGGHASLGIALRAQGQLPEAVRELRTAVQLDPNLLIVQNILAWILATSDHAEIRNGQDAVAIAQALCQATDNKEPQLLRTLAAALAETGQYERAVEFAARGEALARQANQAELAQQIAANRRLFLERKPVRESVATPTDKR